MITQAIGKILADNTGVAALVGERIYTQSAPLEAVYPLITFSLASKVPTNTKDGGSVVDESRIQVDVYSKLALTAGQIEAAVRTALDGYSGTLFSHRIDSIYFEQQRELFDPEQRVYRISTDYFIRELK